MSEKKVLLELRGVKTFFPVRGGFFNKVRDHVQAVNDVDLDIYKGETLGLVGESGCGKTTLGKSIIQLVKATDGTMMYDFGPQHGGKKDLRHLNREDEQVLHRRIQIDRQILGVPRVNRCAELMHGGYAKQFAVGAAQDADMYFSPCQPRQLCLRALVPWCPVVAGPYNRTHSHTRLY